MLEGAEPRERAELYAALGVEITYQPEPYWRWSRTRWVKRVSEGGLAA